METTTIATLLSNVGEVFTAFIGYVGDVCETIVTTPLLLLGTCVGLAFAIIGFAKAIR